MTRTRRKPAWFDHFPTRLRFERQACAVYPLLSPEGVGRGEVAYELTVPIPEYEDRSIEMVLFRSTQRPQLVRIYADGPTDSFHRYKPPERDRRKRNSLCLWHPDDSIDLRWVPEDGLLALIEATRFHLFKEAYSRETGGWPGDEAPHSVPGSKW